MPLFADDMIALAQTTVDALRNAGRRLTTAESCTAGLIAGLLTEIAGSSDVLGRGFIVYSNDAKSELLGVSGSTLKRYGAVSSETVKEMAKGALAAAGADADIAVSVSGIAGPGGGSVEKPVGTVFIGLALRDGEPIAVHRLFPGDRSAVRLATAQSALELVRITIAGQAGRDGP